MEKFIRYKNILRLYEIIQPYIKYSLHVDEKIPASPIVALAPHPDDEAIGCGGSISLSTGTGKEVHVVYLTADNELRKKEAAESLKALGVKNSRFLGFADGSLNREKALPDTLISVFNEIKPEVVLVPFVLDNNLDHMSANQALTKVWEKKKFEFTVYAYPVWSPLYPNVLLDISGSWDAKKRAIECYKSQTSQRDYVSMAYSLGRYWAVAKGRSMEVVETFFRLSFSEYVHLIKEIY
jgi:N-acetylglucosamine malate deacetylase 1